MVPSWREARSTSTKARDFLAAGGSALILAVLFTALLAVPAARADAKRHGAAPVGRCTPSEARSFLRAAKAVALCEQLGLSRCPAARAPRCARAALDDFADLVLGGDGAVRRRRDLRDQRRCQRAIARSGLRFVSKRLAERERGVRSTLRSAQELLPVEGRTCEVEVAKTRRGGIVPEIGGSCAGLLGSPGEIADGSRVARCLRQELGRIVDAVSPTAMPPNILVVMTDDQRQDTLPFMPAVMSRLAEEGVWFTQSFTTTSVCGPSRASFLAGQYARTTGIRTNRPPDGGAPLFDSEGSFVAQLQRAGYRTALLGKYLNGTDLLEEPPVGWDDWQAFVHDGFNFFDYDLNENGRIVHYGASEADYSTDLLRDRAVAFIAEHARGRPGAPFFLDFAPYAPHFDATFFSTTPAPRHEGVFQELPPYRPPSYREPDLSDKPPHVQASSDALWDQIEASGQNDALRRDMLEALLAVDEAVAALLDALEQAGLTDHTLVVYTSDNGYLFGEHQLTGKNQAYEESIRVPLLVRYPMLVSGARSDGSLVLNLDLAPTFLELAEVEPSTPLAGRSLVGLLRDPAAAASWREDFLGEHYRVESGIFGALFPDSRHDLVRGAEWKYVEHQDPFFLELYHRPTDPFELRNVAADPAFLQVLVEHFFRLREIAEEIPGS